MLLAATASWTVPLPFPAAPADSEIHEALLAAVQAQPPWAWTEIEADPPAGPSDTVDGDTANVQGAACCETAKF